MVKLLKYLPMDLIFIGFAYIVVVAVAACLFNLVLLVLDSFAYFIDIQVRLAVVVFVENL
jgi:hypothetical protein